MTEPGDPLLIQSLPVLDGDDLRCIEGAALGDPLEPAALLMLDDIYAVASGAAPRLLSVESDGASLFVGPGEAGRRGNGLALDALLTFMLDSGATVDALLLAETEGEVLTGLHLHPLAPVANKEPMRLVGLDRAAAATRFAELASASFTRGTAITLHDGRQADIETLEVGTRVLTRDAGSQPIRWIGRSTLRATGPFAPILIRRGVLNNARDLLLSPAHRLFVYQREDLLGVGRAEVLVQARHLVDGRGVLQIQGGFVDYVQLVFDEHQIVYAEGIAAESLMLDTRSRPVVPEEIAKRLTQGAVLPRDYEVDEAPAGAAEALRRASAR